MKKVVNGHLHCTSTFFILGCLTGTLTVAHAGVFKLESESFLSARRGFFDSKLETPLREDLAGTYQTDDKQLQINTNFSLFADPLRYMRDTSPRDPNQKDARLYTGEAKYDVIPDRLRIRVGRSFDTHYSIGANSMDALCGELLFFERQLQVGGFIGIERKAEEKEVGTAFSTINGAHIRYLQADMFPWSMTAKIQERVFPDGSLTANQRLTQLAVTKPTDMPWSPLFMGDLTWNIDTSSTDSLELGSDLFPSTTSGLRFRATSFLLKTNELAEQPIYTVFARGRLYEGMVQYEKQFSNVFLGSISVADDNYPATLTTHENGYRFDLQTRYTPEAWNTDNTVYYFSSYGGQVYGDRIRFTQKLSTKYETFQMADVTYYRKITGSNRFATHLEAGLRKWFADGFKLDGVGEVSNNNVLAYDFRAVLKLTYMLWTEGR